MEVYKIGTTEEINTYTGEPETVTTYGIDTKNGYFEIETKDTAINGTVTLQGADYNTPTLEEIYKYFDETGNYELYLDNSGTYTYIDVTTWGSPSDLDDIKEKILEVLGGAEK
jgi:hypothetical protein